MAKTGHNETLRGGGFHHVAVRAHDFEAALKFYMEGLGFRRTYGWGSDNRAEGGRDSRAVMLDTGDGNYLEVFAGGVPPKPDQEEGTILHMAFRTNNCAEALERAREAGAVVTAETKTVPIHGDTLQDFCIAFCKGPCGEIIEFFENPNL